MADDRQATVLHRDRQGALLGAQTVNFHKSSYGGGFFYHLSLDGIDDVRDGDTLQIQLKPQRPAPGEISIDALADSTNAATATGSTAF